MRSTLLRFLLLTACATSTALTLTSPSWASEGAKRIDRPLAPLASRQSNDTQNRSVRIHNQTGWTMTALNASSGGTWTDDLLGGTSLVSGRSTTVSLDDGSGACRYALRAQFDNGETLQRSGINSCQIADYYFTR